MDAWKNGAVHGGIDGSVVPCAELSAVLWVFSSPTVSHLLKLGAAYVNLPSDLWQNTRKEPLLRTNMRWMDGWISEMCFFLFGQNIAIVLNTSMWVFSLGEACENHWMKLVHKELLTTLGFGHYVLMMVPCQLALCPVMPCWISRWQHNPLKSCQPFWLSHSQKPMIIE